MSKLEYAWWCFVLASVFGATWGGAMWWIFTPTIGVCVGSILACLCYVVLFNNGANEFVDEQENKVLNDV